MPMTLVVYALFACGGDDAEILVFKDDFVDLGITLVSRWRILRKYRK
jgi:hypothetical protein